LPRLAGEGAAAGRQATVDFPVVAMKET
jgi:hypothetical protein